MADTKTEEAPVGRFHHLRYIEGSTREKTQANDSPDYSLANPDTLTKYKTAAQISQKVLETVSGQHCPAACLTYMR